MKADNKEWVSGVEWVGQWGVHCLSFQGLWPSCGNHNALDRVLPPGEDLGLGLLGKESTKNFDTLVEHLNTFSYNIRNMEFDNAEVLMLNKLHYWKCRVTWVFGAPYPFGGALRMSLRIYESAYVKKVESWKKHSNSRSTYQLFDIFIYISSSCLRTTKEEWT